MYNIVFVHGTGVREPQFSETFAAINTCLRAALPDASLHPCFWGESLGSNIRQGRSIPRHQQTMAVGEPGLEDDPLMQWAILLDDPLIELKLVAAQGNVASASAASPLGQNPRHIIKTAIATLRTSAESGAVQGITPAEKMAFIDAIADIVAWDGLDAAVKTGIAIAPSGANLLDAVRLLIARAIIAGWMRRINDAGQIPPSATGRDALLGTCFTQLGGGQVQTKGLGGDILKEALRTISALWSAVAVNPAKRAAVEYTKANRHRWTNFASPFISDILLYQGRGQAIRNFIAQTVETIGQPVILIAHSLGGIACIDLLIEQHRPLIKGVITVGSQAPFFYEIDALSQLEYGQALPPHMPPWLNFYDPADVLAFIGESVMTGGNGVHDIEIASGQPFLLAHSAYWNSQTMWQHAAQFIREKLA